MKKHFVRLMALLLAASMLAACGSNSVNTAGSTETTSAKAADLAGLEYPVTPDELGSGEVKWSEEKTADGWMKVTNEGGDTLGYSPDSGVKLIQVDGYAFKDLNKNGVLDAYEDWRLDNKTRAVSLASELTPDEIIPMMVVSMEASFIGMSGRLQDDQKALLDEGKLFLHGSTTSDLRGTVQWVNEAQEYVESGKYGIPLMLHDDPYTSGRANVTTFPNNLALGATFDPDIAEEMGMYVSKVYRAIGVGTLLGPQMDISTEPRWSRMSGTFGEDPALSRDMANASTSGHQSTYDDDGNDMGWGDGSVNAMIKHWPGDGAAQFGREGHNATGAYSVYPGNNFDAHVIAFIDGALNLDSITEMPTGVMPSYSMAWTEDESLGERVGSAFSEYKLSLLRSYGFDGLICTDWEVLPDAPTDGEFVPGKAGKPWGVEDLTPAERAYKAMKAGVDQFGGQSDLTTLRDGYQLLVDDMGEEDALAHIQKSASRILTGSFNVGFFENAYLSTQNIFDVLNDEDAAAAAHDAQVKSVVMLKNDGAIAENTENEKPTVYVPMVYSNGNAALPVDISVLNEYFNVVTDTLSETKTGEPDRDGNATYAYEDIIRANAKQLSECDFALVFASAPMSSSVYDSETDTYLPISLQYRPYTANSASVRQESIAGPMTEVEIVTPYGVQKDKAKANVAYYGNSTTTGNETDLDMILYAAENMPQDAKVIVAINASNPMVFSEFEEQVDAILIGFGIDDDIFLDIVTGKVEPSGLLPIQMPANMETVEAQYEDVPRDMECYVDSKGNTYDFAFGLNWSGVISDERTAKYNVAPLTEPATQPVNG